MSVTEVGVNPVKASPVKASPAGVDRDSTSRDSTSGLVEAVRSAVSQVCDPEYPDLTIAQLGILEKVWLRPTDQVVVDLVPTMLGCPALDLIRRDVEAAARQALESFSAELASTDPALIDIEVRFLSEPAWTPSRISKDAQWFLQREYTIAIRTKSAIPSCPACGADGLEHRSDFGPTPCRSVYWCPSCRNPIEIIGSRATNGGATS